jgi:chromosome segregation ATPase
MEYLKPYTDQQVITTSLTLLFGVIFTRKLYKKKLLKEIETEKIKQIEIDDLKNEISFLRKENDKLNSENDKMLKEFMDVCSKLSEKKKILEETNGMLEEYYRDKIKDKRVKKIDEYGSGPIRYKSKCGTIYYHGMGHLENKYMWWESKMNRKVIEYKNKEKSLKFPDFETHDIESFCNNCEYCEDINKKQRNKFYYECKGHKINVE